MHTRRLQCRAFAEKYPLREMIHKGTFGGMRAWVRRETERDNLVLWFILDLEHEEFIKFFWSLAEITPEHYPIIFDLVSTKWLLFINMLSKSLRGEAVEDQGQKSCNYFLSYPVWGFVTHPINSWGRFHHPLHLGWLCDLFWKVECGSCDGWYARSKPRSPEVLNNPFSETCIATMGTHSSQLAWWWETYYFGWLLDNTGHVCEAIFDQPLVNYKCLNEPKREDLNDQWPRSAEMPTGLRHVSKTKCLLFQFSEFWCGCYTAVTNW